jgi:hypothetical protein
MNQDKAEGAPGRAPSDDDQRDARTPADLRALVRLLQASAAAGGGRLTNTSAGDDLAPDPSAAAGESGPDSRTALMALRDLVWRVDTARILIEPQLTAAGRADLAALLSTDDIHALLRDLA